MLSISGKNSLTSNTVEDSSVSQSFLATNSQTTDVDESHLNQKDGKVLGTGSQHLSNRERVQRLIDSIKIKQEMGRTSESSKVNSEENTQISLQSWKTTGASFQNRFLAQKNIIDMQKLRLLEQERIINELKMGILSKDDIPMKDKFEITELFQDCKLKLLGRVPLDYIPKTEDLHIKPQSAPKIIKELERRALERMKYREMIKERKKILEDTKKKLQEENMRRKHQMEEEERLKHLEMLSERHRKEKERMKLRQINKEAFLKNFNKAVLFHEQNILRKSFHKWKLEYFTSTSKWTMSGEYYTRKVLEKYFKILLNIVLLKSSQKCRIADEFRRKILLKRSLQGFKENHLDGIRCWQVAEDFDDFRIERKFFTCLLSFTSKEKILRDIKDKQASYHYERKLIFSSFFHWKSLPIVLKMEKVKEERKQKWRKKVLEILPDFSPDIQ